MSRCCTVKLAIMRMEGVCTRARTEGRKMPYQRDKPHFTEKSAVPDAYHIRTASVPGGGKWGGGVMEYWGHGVVLLTVVTRLGL